VFTPQELPRDFFSVSYTALPVGRLGSRGRWEGTQLGQLTPADQRDTPCGAMPSNKSCRGRKKSERTQILLWSRGIILPVCSHSLKNAFIEKWMMKSSSFICFI